MKFGQNLFSGLAAMLKITQTMLVKTGGPVVSHIDNLSMWLFSVGDGHASHEIWVKFV
jgi:hypothetical protein